MLTARYLNSFYCEPEKKISMRIQNDFGARLWSIYGVLKRKTHKFSFD